MRYPDGSSERAPKIVEPQWRLGQTFLVHEPIVRIHLIVSKVFEQQARVSVRSGPCDQADLSPRGAAELGRECGGLDAELLQRIRRYQVAKSAEEVVCGNHRACSLRYVADDCGRRVR